MVESWKTDGRILEQPVEESWKHLEAGTVDGEAVHEREENSGRILEKQWRDVSA